MSKQRAFVVHLFASAALVGLVCALVFFFWYPAPYFSAKGTWTVLAVLLGVDLVVGPLLTLYLYRPQKPGLMIDMSVIVVVQLAALIYGTAVIYTERPYFTVFAVDRFEVVARREVDTALIASPELRDKPLAGPVLAVALLPEAPEELQKLLEEVIIEGKPDIDRRPEYWQPYAAHAQRVIDKSRSLNALTAREETRPKVERLLRRLGRPIEELSFLPLIGKDRDFAFVIDKQTGEPLDLIDVDPWPDRQG
jgi:hypothetical protein